MSYSPALVSREVPSALQSLTSVFEMGTGVASMLLSPVSFLEINVDDLNIN